jgi:hypothetical protein
MTPAERRWYLANRDDPDFKAKRSAATKRCSEAKLVDGVVYPAVGERFDDWVKRWAELEGRALFAVRAAAMHERLVRAAAGRKAQAAVAVERVRAGKVYDPIQRKRLADWRQPGEFFTAGMVTSVFDLGQLHAAAVTPGQGQLHPAGVVTPTRPVTPAGRRAAAGGVAERREGGAAPLSADPYKAATWRAPWAAPYALSKRGRSP